jgi:hypothetical protein
MSVVYISIDPKNLNREDLLRLSLLLKEDFCKEERLFVVLFDDATYIDRILWSSHPLFERRNKTNEAITMWIARRVRSTSNIALYPTFSGIPLRQFE